MIRGLYTAASGMLAGQFVQDAVASNISNASTTAFKQDIPTFRAVAELALRRYNGVENGGVPVGKLGLGVIFDHTTPDLAQGALLPTGAKTDFALEGAGFFAVQTPNGERYTRDGQFRMELDQKTGSYFTDGSGNRVLGENGVLNLQGAKSVEVRPDGTVLADGKAVDKLKIIDVSGSALLKEGGNLYTFSGNSRVSKAKVQQGFLEQSNVSPIAAMVKLITVQRAYEAAAKAVTSQDESLSKVVNELGKS